MDVTRGGVTWSDILEMPTDEFVEMVEDAVEYREAIAKALARKGRG